MVGGLTGDLLVHVRWYCTCENNSHCLCEVMDLPGWSHEHLASLSQLQLLYIRFSC